MIKSLPNNKILVMTKLKVFADDKLNVAKMLFSLFDRVENSAEKGENAELSMWYVNVLCELPMWYERNSF